MTELQIRQLIRRCERGLKWKSLHSPFVGWSLSAGYGGLLWAFFAASPELVFMLGIEAILVAISGYASALVPAQFRLLKQRHAQQVWKRLAKHEFAAQSPTPATKRLVASIAQLYFYDPQGETLPLSQAIRLLDTHHKQQQRLVDLNARLSGLNDVRARLKENLARLRRLGEQSESGEQSLRELDPDEANLRELKRQIEASCARLELLLPRIERALQVRMLHREVSLLSGAAQQNGKLEVVESDEIAGQITREIETYLQLERESEAHFR